MLLTGNVPIFAFLLVSLLSALGACCSAFFSWRSSRIAATAAVGNIYLKFREQYGSPEMLLSLRNLRAWREKHGDNFAEIWKEKYVDNDPEAMAINLARRHVAHFFFSIGDLHESGLFTERWAQLVTRFQGIDIFYDIVEPLDRALNADYAKYRYDNLRLIQPSSGRGQPIQQRYPVIDLPRTGGNAS